MVWRSKKGVSELVVAAAICMAPTLWMSVFVGFHGTGVSLVIGSTLGLSLVAIDSLRDSCTKLLGSLDKASASGVQTSAVVKANAYGLGAHRVSRALAQAGGDNGVPEQAPVASAQPAATGAT